MMNLRYTHFKKTFAAVLFLYLSFIGSPLSRINGYCGGFISNIAQNEADAEKSLKYYFESKGFKTGTIKIPELNVEVALEKNQFYKKEEDIIDVNERINELRNQFGLPAPYHDYVEGYGWCGRLEAAYSGKKAYGYLILISKNLNDSSRIYTQAHENGHFLWYIGQQELIYQKFKDPSLVKSQIQNEEDFVNLCGWIALKMAGYKLNDCFIINIENPAEEARLVRLRDLVKKYLMD